MTIGVPREIHEGEMRVATTPDVVAQLLKLGFSVAVESGAGAAASFDDEAFRKAGATVVADTRALWSASDIILKVRPPARHPVLNVDEVDLLREGQTLISFLWPAQRPELARATLAQGRDDARDGQRAAHLARAEDGRAELDGQHRRLSRGRRGRAALRPLLHRPDHRRRHGTAGQGPRHRRRRRRPRRHRRRRSHSARSCARSTRDPRSRNRSRAWTPSSLKLERQGRRRGRRRLREGDEPRVHQGRNGALRPAGEGRRHHHHDRADSRQAGAEADDRRHGAS